MGKHHRRHPMGKEDVRKFRELAEKDEVFAQKMMGHLKAGEVMEIVAAAGERGCEFSWDEALEVYPDLSGIALSDDQLDEVVGGTLSVSSRQPIRPRTPFGRNPTTGSDGVFDSHTGGGGGAGGAGGAECFLATACVRARGLPDHCEELEALREFRDRFVRHTEEGGAFVSSYYDIAPKVVAAIDASEDASEIWQELYLDVEACVRLIREGDQDSALEMARVKFEELQARHLVAQ